MNTCGRMQVEDEAPATGVAGEDANALLAEFRAETYDSVYEGLRGETVNESGVEGVKEAVNETGVEGVKEDLKKNVETQTEQQQNFKQEPPTHDAAAACSQSRERERVVNEEFPPGYEHYYYYGAHNDWENLAAFILMTPTEQRGQSIIVPYQ